MPAAAGINSFQASHTNSSTNWLRSARALTESPVCRNSSRILCSVPLERCFSTIIIPDPNGFGDVIYKDFSIADFAGARSGGQGLDHLVRARRRHHQLYLHLRQQVHVVLLAAVNLFVTLLPAMAAHFRDGHAIHADGLE